MARTLTLGNGSLLVGIDARGHVRDLYFPYVGLENHISSPGGTFTHRIGVWVDGVCAWLDDPSWEISIEASHGTMAGTTHAVHKDLQITLSITDAVVHDQNIFIREVALVSEVAALRDVKLFFAQQFRIAEDRGGSTGFYDPRVHAVVHYKGKIVFLVGGTSGTEGFDDYSIGLFNMESHEGTYKDAEDGLLSKNPIEHGSVDSVIGFTRKLSKRTPQKFSYWIAAGETIADVHDLHRSVMNRGASVAVRATKEYWRSWLGHPRHDIAGILGARALRIHEQSLFVMTAHADRRGGIIASSDSDILNYGRDTYSYVWPRDGAFIAQALDGAGHSDVARSFFIFICGLLESGGYLMHKYRPDGALGSSWHPWVWGGKLALPIQADETATVLAMLWRHYVRTHDKELILGLGESAEHMADFLVRRLDRETRLPFESYDLWEENFGTATYTASSVYAGLMAGAHMMRLLRKEKKAHEYGKVAVALKQVIGERLFDKEHKAFFKYVRHAGGGLEYSKVIDISGLHGIWSFGVLEPDDSRVVAMFEAVERTLRLSSGGYMRYEEDQYFRAPGSPPNPWIVTTLWVARYHIARARTTQDLESARALIGWVEERALPTYMLSEQVSPETGGPLSATPLVWSHAEFVLTVEEYVQRYEALVRG